MYLIFLTLSASLVLANGLNFAQDILQDIINIHNNIALIHSNVCGNFTEDDVRFLMYTNNNRDTPVYITANDSSALNLTLQVKIIIHSWIQNYTHKWIIDSKNAYLSKGNYVVIVVDWTRYAYLNYAQSRCYVPKVGKAVANLIVKSGLVLNKIHVIGFSLGAHVAGIAGKQVQISKNGEKFYRITGLDAAGPLFYLSAVSERLYKTDATFVDGIHTNSGKFGFADDYGKADFHPNCGILQNSCLVVSVNSTLSLNDNIFNNVMCSHALAFEYFVESIKSNKFLGRSCGTCAWFLSMCWLFNPQTTIMGEGCPTTAQGSYYLGTKMSSPYALG